jgi:hypothetical protein
MYEIFVFGEGNKEMKGKKATVNFFIARSASGFSGS